MVVTSLGFLFATGIPDTELNKLATQTPMVQTKKSSGKACSLKPEDQEQSNLQRQITFRSIWVGPMESQASFKVVRELEERSRDRAV